MPTTTHEDYMREADWIEETLRDLGLTLETTPAETIHALRQSFARITDEHGDERRTEIPPEIPDEPSKARGSKVRKAPPRRRGGSYRKDGRHFGVKNRDAEITDRQAELLLKLRDDYGDKLVKLFAEKHAGVKFTRAIVLTEDAFRGFLNRGQASDLIGALLKAQKAGEIDKV